jgi:hypothetical protein
MNKIIEPPKPPFDMVDLDEKCKVCNIRPIKGKLVNGEKLPLDHAIYEKIGSQWTSKPIKLNICLECMYKDINLKEARNRYFGTQKIISHDKLKSEEKHGNNGVTF